MDTTYRIDYPLHFDDGRGRTVQADDEKHIRDLIEQVMFTTPGERVNRPTFGSGILQLVFAPTSDALAGATQFVVHSALQQWLGDLIGVSGVDVVQSDSTLSVTVRYTILRTRTIVVEQFTREV